MSKTSTPQGDAVRHRAPRFVLDWGIFCAFSKASGNSPRRALLHDISGQGVAFILAEPLAQGSTLTVRLPAPRNQEPRNLVARVTHCTQVCDSAWLVGCSLSEALSESDLAALLKVEPGDDNREQVQPTPAPRAMMNRRREPRRGPLGGICASLLPGRLGLGRHKKANLMSLSEAGATVQTRDEFSSGQEVTLTLDAAFLQRPIELPATVSRVSVAEGIYSLGLVLRKPLAYAELVRVTKA